MPGPPRRRGALRRRSPPRPRAAAPPGCWQCAPSASAPPPPSPGAAQGTIRRAGGDHNPQLCCGQFLEIRACRSSHDNSRPIMRHMKAAGSLSHARESSTLRLKSWHGRSRKGDFRPLYSSSCMRQGRMQSKGYCAPHSTPVMRPYLGRFRLPCQLLVVLQLAPLGAGLREGFL